MPDASLEPWQLVEANLRRRGRARGQPGAALPPGRRRSSATAAFVSVGLDRRRAQRDRRADRAPDRRLGRRRVGRPGRRPGRRRRCAMSPGKGTMLVYNQRMTDTVINRCTPPGDGDIMVPVHTVAILGTTDIPVERPRRLRGHSAAEIDGPARTRARSSFPTCAGCASCAPTPGVRPLYAAAGRRSRSGGERPARSRGPTSSSTTSAATASRTSCRSSAASSPPTG